jgi:hypothetical protein
LQIHRPKSPDPCLQIRLLSFRLSFANPTPSSSGSNLANSTPAANASDTPPVIQINGDNPATIQVGATYTDLGATITGPTADLNLGITTYVNGSPMNPVQLDPTQAATDTIDYVVTDQSGLTSSAPAYSSSAPSTLPFLGLTKCTRPQAKQVRPSYTSPFSGPSSADQPCT